MTTGMLQQDTVHTSPSGSGPRFRPYASPNHHVTKGRYITSNDVRGYIPVYEYPLNGQWIMMDIDDGYILWTGIWKALGNSKADIVKMIDSQPDLAPLIRRVRGGYLKIQGTWMPYEVALKLSRRVAWTIRDDLIPLFGPTFPSTCLSPDQPGYGQVVPSGQGRRRARRSTQSAMMQQIPRAPAGWTVVTPSTNMAITHGSTQHSPIMHTVRSQDYMGMPSPYSVHAHIPSHGPSSEAPQYSQSPTLSMADPQPRYGSSYTPHPPTSFRKPSAPSKMGLTLDIRSLSMREGSSVPSPQEDIRLPPIHASNGNREAESPYALPPISVMEDPRGSVPQDSAAVLRRLRMDDEAYPKVAKSVEDLSWARRHSLSVHPSSSKPADTSPRFQPYHSPRPHQEHPPYRPRSSSSSTNYSYHHHHHPAPQAEYRPVWSEATSHEGDSTSNPSPTSPRTPNSLSDNEERKGMQAHYHGGMIREKTFPGIAGRMDGQWSPSPQDSHVDGHGRISEPQSFPVRRNSYEVQSDSDSTHPHRPW